MLFSGPPRIDVTSPAIIFWKRCKYINTYDYTTTMSETHGLYLYHMYLQVGVYLEN
jgi:hypothetical protein